MRRPAGRGWAAGALVVAAVVTFDPGGLAPFGPAKALVVPVLVLLALVPTRSGALRVDRGTAMAWLVLLAWLLVSTVVAVDGWPAWVGTFERRYGFVTWVLCGLAFVAGQQANDDDGRRRLVTAAAVAGAVSGAVAVLELAGLRAVDLVGAGERPVGTMGSSAFLGAAMALVVPVAVLAAAEEVDRRRRWLLAAAGGLGTVALVASGARAAWVGVAVAAVWALRRRGRRPTWPGAAAAVAAVVVLALATGVADRVPDALTSDRGGAGGRLDEWRVALRVVAERPVTGAGPEGYRVVFGAAVDDRYEQEHGRDPIPDRAHSAPLDVAAVAGLPGLALLAVLVALVVCRASGADGPLAAGVLAYAVGALFLFPLAELDPAAWLLVGACLPAAAATATVRLPRVVPLLAAGVFAAVGLAGLAADRAARDGDPARAAALRPDVVRYHLEEAAEHEAVGSSAGLDRAIAAVDRAARTSPLDPAVRSERTRLLLDRARRTGSPRHVTTARRALEELADRDPRNAEVLLRLGVARALDGDDRGAESAWLAAERLAPRSPAASVDLALAYARQGRDRDAAEAARRALARDPGNPEAQAVLRALERPDGT